MQTSLLIAASALPCAAWAQDAAEDTDIIVTATGAEQRADEVGLAVTVIDAETVERRQTVILSDLLLTTPGVAVARNGGPGTVTYARLRGAESGQTLVLIDGVRTNDPSAPDGAFDFGSLFTTGIERVEVLRGPASVPWGSQAIGGVVNVITRRPGPGFSARARGEYGTFETVVGQSGIGYGGERIRARIDGGYFTTHGISAAASGSEADGYERWGANGRVEFDLTPDVAIDLRGSWSDGRTDLDGFSPTFEFVDTDEYSTSKELYGYAGIKARLGGLNNRLGFSIADIDRDNFASSTATEPSFFARGRSERYEYRGDLAITEQVRAVFGAEHEDSRLFDGTDRFESGITSVFGELIVKPIEMLTITGGVRHDDHEDFGGNTTFAANAALALPTDTILRASYGEGFKAPTLFQLNAPGFGNIDLQAETAESWDAGIEQQLVDGALSIAATWFHRDTVNQIDFDLVSFTYSNIAATSAEGLEVAIRARPNRDWLFDASYSLVDSKNRSAGFAGNELARRPRHSVSASIDYAPQTGPALGATITHVGDSFDNPANTVRLDGYVLVGLRAAIRLADRYELYGRIDNAFDERYQTVATYGAPGRAAYVGIRARFE
ncbi:TonB-dependent receptor plug domain-containing protein [Sphingomonas gilva]|uniref:TonB-dependent receptor plug domain-containing protein n=1 Tax=Sphingomonas gilva TaxID=2305907 RepID=UPI001FE6232F|nr:TonB-dependent receptor [Sphingomonas gilva]